MQFPRLHAVLIVGMACLLMIPALLSPPMTHDSFWIDWVWADQFTAELANGNLYPRWLPKSHNGLGSPVFYYYPPLAFYVTGIFGLAGLSTYASIIAAFFVGLLGSGFAMHAWLKGHATMPVAGTLLYMAAPYHLLDFYVRGALAEFMAIALIPVLALGLRRAAEGRIILATLAYAALILTHLPLALLVSIFLVAPYSLYLAHWSPSVLLRFSSVILLGIALSAIYLLPALALEQFRDAERLWGGAYLKPQNWSLLATHSAVASTGIRLIFAAMLLALLPPILLLIFSGAGRKAGIYSAACWIVAAGLIPGLWALSLLEAVQFPFRMLPLAEFAIATGIARLNWTRAWLLLVSVPALGLSVIFINLKGYTPLFTIEDFAENYPDVPENLPPGDRPYSWPSAWARGVAILHPTPTQVGAYTVEPLFYFPAWEVRCAGGVTETFPEPSTKLLMHKKGDCERRLTMTPAEKVGGGISLLALLILLVLAARRTRGPRRLRHEAPRANDGTN